MTEPNELLYSGLAVLSIALAYLSWRYVEKPFRKKDVFGRKTIFIFALTGSVAFTAIGLVGYLTNGFYDRSTKSGLTQQIIDEKLHINRGLSDACEGPFSLSPDCRTSDKPEILIWGDSFAMHLVEGIMASNPDAKIIQMTKSVCGPFFDVAPVIEPDYPASWGRSCLEFTGKVREWLKGNNTIKYAVLSSPFSTYLSHDLLFRNGDRNRSDIDIVVNEFEKTLGELKTMGITPVVFSPLPANGIDLGRCLARADWFGVDLDSCNFQVDTISQDSLDTYTFLEIVKEKYPVVRLDKYICDSVICHTHFGSTFVYRDEGHLSHEGSAELGRKVDFYKMIIDANSN